MILTAVAADPATPVPTLLWLARRPRVRHSRAEHHIDGALLTNPSLPSDVSLPVGATLAGRSWAALLTDPRTEPHVRARVLTHPDAAGEALLCCSHLSAVDVELALTAVGGLREGAHSARANSVSGNPGTSHDLAVTALQTGLASSPSHSERIRALTAAHDRGIDLATLRNLGQVGESFVARRRADPTLTWPRHLNNSLLPTDHTWAELGKHTASADVAELALTRAPEDALAVFMNGHLPPATRLRALHVVAFTTPDDGPAWSLPYLTDGAYDLDDEAALAALVIARESAPANAARNLLSELSSAVLGNSHRSPVTLRAIADLLDPLSSYQAPSSGHFAVALHPNCPTDVRDHIAEYAVEPTAGYLRPIAGDRRTGILNVTYQTLRTLSRMTNGHHIDEHVITALAHTGWTATPHRAATLAAVEATFAGTLGDLLAVADAITT